jgi:ubiquitin thioesterase ZRANB1
MNYPTDDDDHDSSYDDIEHPNENVETNSSNTMATTTLIDDKWSCSICTYLNFAVAQKCTMCRQARTTTMDAASADIYQLNASSESNTQQEQAQQQIPATYIDSVEKWPCDQCTFLNYPRAARCTQCGSSRLIGTSRVSPVQPSIDTNTNERISPPPSITDSRLIAQRLRKWTCTRCTTDNYPATKKCISCGNLRHNIPIISTPTCSSSSSSSSTCSSILIGTDEEQRMNAINKSMENINVERISNKESKHNRISVEKRLITNKRNSSSTTSDRLWLKACQTLLDHGSLTIVFEYLLCGGDPTRQITIEDTQYLTCNCLSSIDLVGRTLKNLANITGQIEQFCKFETAFQQLIRQQKKIPHQRRVPANICNRMNAMIQHFFHSHLKLKKVTDFQSYFLTEWFTAVLPAEIRDFSHRTQQHIFDDILDQQVQQELEIDNRIINWNSEVTNRFHSRLYALWNRKNGDCLLDSVLQVCLGVWDTENTLRRAMAECLQNGSNKFFERWSEYERLVAEKQQYRQDEHQLRSDWNDVLTFANQPGESLGHAHIFALSHILRRPIIVYGVTNVKSYRGEYFIGLARFQGVYLPLLWETNFCSKSPICLGFTRNHFSALVPMQERIHIDSSSSRSSSRSSSPLIHNHDNDNQQRSLPSSSPPLINSQPNDNSDTQIFYHPLMDCDGNLLPVHFLTSSEIGHEQAILHQWLDCGFTSNGLLVAKQKVGKRPQVCQQSLDAWLNLYSSTSGARRMDSSSR